MQEVPLNPPLAVQSAVAPAAHIPQLSQLQTGFTTLHWLRCLPFVAMHLMCLGIFWVGWSWTAIGAALLMYGVKMFAITAFYHRYFSHRSFKTSRFCQWLFGVLGCSAVQRGPLWWAAHHRHHHAFSDKDEDIHSPARHGLLWSHTGWFLSEQSDAVHWKFIPDLAKYPELRFLDRFDKLVPILFGVSTFFLGVLINRCWPDAGTSGAQMLIWGFFIATVLCYHCTYLVNSLTHVFGKRPYATHDDSRNSFLIAILTFGEGWHNNHHHYPASARQGFLWWEVDLSYYILVFMSWMGLVWDLKAVPNRVVQARYQPAKQPPTP